jgi:reverse gyrase
LEAETIVASKAKTTTTKRTARRQRVAAKVAAGKTVTAIAREEGVSRATASADANSAETRQILAQLVDEHMVAVRRLFSSSLEVLSDALTAETVVLQPKTGMILTLGPDHYARLTAVGRLTRLLTAGRPVPRSAETEKEAPPPSFAAFLELMEKANAAR